MGLKGFMEKNNLDLLFKGTGELDGFLRIRYNRLSDWIYSVKCCPNTLDDLVVLHRRMWVAGVRCEGLGPSEKGCFRCESIDELSLDKVYLGGVCGLDIFSAYQFGKMRDEHPEMYQIACTQYRNILRSNLEKMRNLVFDGGNSRRNMEEHVLATSYLAFHRGEDIDGAFLRDVRIKNVTLSGSCILKCMLRTWKGEIESSCLMVDYNLFLPEKFEEGVVLTKDNISSVSFFDVSGRDCWCESGCVFHDGDNSVKFSSLSEGLVERVGSLFVSTQTELRRQVASVRDKEDKGYRFGL